MKNDLWDKLPAFFEDKTVDHFTFSNSQKMFGVALHDSTHKPTLYLTFHIDPNVQI